MIARTLLLALLLSGCAASEEDVNSSSLSLRGSEERELKRCPRVDFSDECGRDGRICFDCICLDGGWTCGLSDAQLAEAAAQVPVVSRPSLCERANLDGGSCRNRHEGVVCGDCQCVANSWVCGAAAIEAAILASTDNRPFLVQWCERTNFERPCKRRHEGRVCGDCTCTNRQWICEIPDPTTPAVVTVGGGEETTTTTPSAPQECVNLPDFNGGGQCSNEGQECYQRFSCPSYDVDQDSCVDNDIQAPCVCSGELWICAIPGCLACQTCEAAFLLDGEFCYDEGRRCPNDAENTDCWCQNNRWACVPRIIILPETPTLPSGGVEIETTTAPPPTPDCSSLEGFEVSGRCPNEDDVCIFERINCPYWSPSDSQCVANEFDATCECSGGAWRCALPGCAPCECDVQNLQDGEFCFNEDQECPNDSEGTDCTCLGGTWTCQPRIQTTPPIIVIGGGGSAGGISEGLCSEFDGFAGNFFPCSSTGSSCLLASGNCQAWDSTLGQCVPGTAWEAHCSCSGSWVCDLIPNCVACTCAEQFVEDQRFCYNSGQVCRDQTDSTDCTCDGSSWSCALVS